MAQRKSTGLVNFMADTGSARNALSNSRIYIYSGTQPAAADDAVSGTLLVTLTKGSGTFTAETLPVWQFTVAGSAGTVETVKVGGIECLGTAVTYTTDATTTAAMVATQINAYASIPDFRATSSGDVVSIIGPVGSGASLNTLVLATTVTGSVTAAVVSAGATTTAGVTSVNGCSFQFPAVDGLLSKETTDWSGVAVATGTAGWFRIAGNSDDSNGSSTSYRRLDGAISTSGSEMNLTSTAVTSGGTFAINSGSFTVSK